MTTKYLLSENDVRMYLAVMGKIPKNIFERTKDIFKSMYVIVDLKIKKILASIPSGTTPLFQIRQLVGILVQAKN